MDDDMYDSDESEGSDERLEDDDAPRAPKQALDDDEFQFQMLSSDQVVTYMLECIRETQSIIGLSPTTTRLLLSHCKWDREKLLERFTLSDVERDKLFAEAHVVNPFQPVTTSKSSQITSSSTSRNTRSASSRLAVGSATGSRSSVLNSGSAYSHSYSPSSSTPNAISAVNVAPTTPDTYCEICCSHVPNGNMAGLGCLHRFCEKCWTEYLTTKIMDEGASHTISCPAHGCDILVDDALVIRLIEKPNVRQKYERLIANSFVACHRLLRWCPTPDCGYAARARAATDRRPHLVVCACGNMFCFVCGESWHDPVSCEHLRKWIRKCDDDSETSNWIAANTKECPKCRVTIEKDGGCNHMICKNLSCRNEFCWVCLGPWEPHGSSWYNCNRFDEEEAKKARDNQERSRSSLQRYLFYCNRYMNHLQSLKFEHKLYASVKFKMDAMQAQNTSSWIEVQFLKTAVDTLCTCRRTLMYTYVFAFYLKRNNHSQIFEENQKDLENATEKLSEYLEREITADNIIEMKQRVQDQYRYCEDRRKKLLDHVHEGVDADIWEYTEPAN